MSDVVRFDIEFLTATIASLYLELSRLRAENKELSDRAQTDAEVERPARKARPTPNHPPTDPK